MTNPSEGGAIVPKLENPYGDTEFDPVRAFLGCLMCCSAERARELLAGMRPTDAGHGVREVVFELAVRVTAAGIAPDPQVLVAEARRRGLLATADRAQSVAMWVFETYQRAPWPEAGWFLRTAVLEAAYRRAVGEHAQRVVHAAATAPVEQLPGLVEPSDELVDLWQRLAADLARWQRDVSSDVIEHRRAA
ncbi:hypothetical protein [Saccharopolyspora endophytica]|uniref:Uncharacterized protein n=1 Tax=Saccharopolyspora endophytica TaxID=543886 RepID=A0ABS5DQE5_9PSEU|nr:hypothetical protein [Saccharopolyspora endophytica]MBQ0928538.1 hypothetical protein [Saccharopolyspora endophytica]